ncbi:MAG: hypothetical protein MMC33_005409 [Icmadophila ericetorum]|nr:hypothetical protein [Icmadophila ericetorum]
MIIRVFSLALGASVLLNAPFVLTLSPSEIPSDTPIASLVSSAKANLAQGKANDALTYFDVAVSRDPKNYLTIFQRGATYLSLGQNVKANEDFDRVLSIKPDFEGALLQRAKIKSRSADWEGAKKDYQKAKKLDSPDFNELLEAEGAATLAQDAAAKGDWEGCVSQAGTAIMVASTALSLRELRAKCRFERGEVLEGMADLQHVLQIAPRSTEPHLQISSMMFYALGETEKGLQQIRKCLHSDPDSKVCGKVHKRMKKLEKMIRQIESIKQKKQWNGLAKLLVGTGEDTGLIDDVKEDVKEAREMGRIHEKAPNELYTTLIELACESYTGMNNKAKALPYCDEALVLNPNSLPGLLAKAQRQLDAEEFEPCIATLNQAKEHHPVDAVQSLLQKAHTLLKRSKTKDYYKVLGVATDADGRTIKKAYRKKTLEYHPDKVRNTGVSKEEAEKKMASINEAYEVLSDSELRARFDRGDDPNSHENQGNPFHGSPFAQGGGGQQFFFHQGGGGGGFKFQQQGFQFAGGFPGFN